VAELLRKFVDQRPVRRREHPHGDRVAWLRTDGPQDDHAAIETVVDREQGSGGPVDLVDRVLEAGFHFHPLTIDGVRCGDMKED
jgi:hypothetical protein